MTKADALTLQQQVGSIALCESGQLLVAMDVPAERIATYGKGAIVGELGELEHGALWHVPGGYAMGALLMPWLASTYGFTAVFGTGAVLCLMGFTLVAWWIHEPPVMPTRSDAVRASPLGDRQVWRSAAAISLLCVPQFAVLTYAAVFFHDALGVGAMTVSIILALVQVGAIVGRLWSGRWTDRRNNRRAFLKGCAVLSALTFVGVGIAVPLLDSSPVAAALFWAGYSLLVRYQAASESSHTIVVYLLIFSTPFNAMLALPEWQWPSETQWLLVAASGVLSALAQMSIARAYSVAEASFVQPFDFAKLPMNVLAGWLVFGWAPPGRLWLGAAIIIGAITLLTHLEQRAHKSVS